MPLGSVAITEERTYRGGKKSGRMRVRAAQRDQREENAIKTGQTSEIIPFLTRQEACSCHNAQRLGVHDLVPVGA